MIFGYARVSTEEQNEARQIKILKDYGIEERNIFIDKKSGKDTNRKQLQALLSEYTMRQGDVLMVESVSRLARNTKDLLQIVETLENKGVSLISKKENFDTTTAQGKFVLTIFSALAQMERDWINERCQEGREIAKAQGKFKGKQPKKIDREEFEKAVKEWRSGEITAKKCMEILNLKPNTFYRRVKEWNL